MGDIEQLERRRAMLDAELERLRSQVQALDTSIHLLDARVRAAAAGTITRHCKEYGGRGALKEFLVRVIRETAKGLPLRVIAARTATHFDIEFVIETELTRYCHNSIRPQLQQLREEGVVESIQVSHPKKVLLWRGKRALLSLADLEAMSKSSGIGTENYGLTFEEGEVGQSREARQWPSR